MVAKAIIVGHIGKKESKVVKGDKQLVVLSIATNTSHKNDMGEKVEVTSVAACETGSTFSMVTVLLVLTVMRNPARL